MSFNIFGPATKDSIRVGYISTERGFVDGITICEANEYAKSNPGTQFIFKTRDYIKYLNINEVNKLTTDDIVSSGSTCSGVKFDNKCGPAKAYFYGGGGIGVQGNPVIGEDGALLAIDLVHRGYGYQYPPIVEVRDNCGIGAGAVTRAVLGEVVETVETYPTEEDFEEYELCEPTDVGYGLRYSPDGKIAGKWDPTLYANITSQNPIDRQIKEYQEFLEKLPNPWWTSRKKAPLKITSQNRENRTKFDVQYVSGFFSWSEFMNTHAISPVPPSNARGTDFAGIPFTIEWEEEFPYDGEYIFRGVCDERGELYLDNLKIDTLRFATDTPNAIKKTVKAGVHRIRVDLFNPPIKDITPPPKKSNLPTTSSTVQTGILCHAGGGFGGTLDGTRQDKVGKVIVGKGGDGGPGQPGDAKRGGYAGIKQGGQPALPGPSLEFGQGFTGALSYGTTLDGTSKKAFYEGIVSSVVGSNFDVNSINNAKEQNKKSAIYGFGGVGAFGIINSGVRGTWSSIASATNGGDGAARIKYGTTVKDYIKPGTYEFTVPSRVTSLDLICIGGGGSGSSVRIPASQLKSESASGTGGSGGAYAYNKISVTPGSKLKIVVGSGGKFSVVADQYATVSAIKTLTDASGSVDGQDTYIEVVSTPSSKSTSTALSKAPTSISSNKTTASFKGNVFNTVDYINKADRKLWRAFPSIGRDGEFLQQYGITPFDPSTSQANTDSFAGKHIIRWERVEFPVDGNYIIEIMADDNATMYIGNRDGDGKANIGNGLIDVNAGGDEVIIRKRGFTASGRSTGKSTETKFFKAGKYRILVELEQLPGKPLAQGNPMALAVNIKPIISGQEVISSKSWMENPMGVALTIDAPEPPVPQEPAPQQEGRCPPNPIWSTRFPNAKEKWYPVTYTDKMREANRMTGAPDWTKFMKRYAISPVKPLDTPGSDGGGVVHTNSWEVDIPYDGYYSFAVQRGDTARLYLDGNLAFDVKTAGDAIWKDFRNKPKFQKVFISKGRHTIGIEVENNVGRVNTTKEVEQVVFKTSDWFAPATPPSTPTSAPKTVDVNFNIKTSQDAFLKHIFKITELDISIEKPSKTLINKNIPKKVEVGKIYTIDIEVPPSGGVRPNITLDIQGNTLIMEDLIVNKTSRDLWFTASTGRFFDIKNNGSRATCKFIVDGEGKSTVNKQSTGPITKNGIVYEGPTPIANYLKDFISPRFNDVNAIPNEEVQDKTWIFKWSNVNFPEDGQYILETEADDLLVVKVDGIKVGTAKYLGGRKKTFFNISKGKRTIELELSNIRIPDTGFPNNGVVAFVKISRKVKETTTVGASWIQNPVVIGATLIPPPCPKKIKGKGIIERVIVDDPGNGYPKPNPNTDPNITPTYPVTLKLSGVEVVNPGINYRCGEDVITITPDNGAVLDYRCDTFGRIVEVNVPYPGEPITTYPEISIQSETGVNVKFRPIITVVRDPVDVPPERLIQVTDLVGLKQTGYVEGRPYYGAVFYKDGVRYAGYYETPGKLVQVYDTLQESIDAQVTTPPSAIQRQGTDIRSNDPRLNIPGTPENLI